MLRVLYSDRPHQFHEVIPREETVTALLIIKKKIILDTGWLTVQDTSLAAGTHKRILGTQEAPAEKKGQQLRAGVQGVVL